MSLLKVQNYEHSQYAINSGSVRSYYSNSSSIASRKEVFVNAAYNSSEYSGESSNHDYEDLQSVIEQAQRISEARRKANDLYEPTGPLHPRIRQITECSDDSSAFSGSLYGPSSTRESCLSHLILFLILVVSLTALILVVLIINGTLGPRDCKCTDYDRPAPSASATEIGGAKADLLERIRVLERNLSGLHKNMEARDKNVKERLEKHEIEVNVTVDTLKEKLGIVKSSINLLNQSYGTLTSTTSELRNHQTSTMQMNIRMAVNVTRLESQVQQLATGNRHVVRSVKRLEVQYDPLNASTAALEVSSDRQNATLQNLVKLSSGLGKLITEMNATLNQALIKTREQYYPDKILKDAIDRFSHSIGSSNFKVSGNFSLCQHKKIAGPSASVNQGPMGGNGANAYAEYREPVDKRVVGAVCSTDYARDYKLTIVESGQNYYHCNCLGVSPVVTTRPTAINCFLYVWECQL